jgi:hypothetical protein
MVAVAVYDERGHFLTSLRGRNGRGLFSSLSTALNSKENDDGDICMKKIC